MALDWLFTKTTFQACWPPHKYIGVDIYLNIGVDYLANTP